MYGLLERDIKFILKGIERFPEIEEVIIFGSRAMGNYKKGSDIDIVLKGEKVNKNIVLRVSDVLNEVYPLPYFFDVLNYKSISNEELIDHINKFGKRIYSKTS